MDGDVLFNVMSASACRGEAVATAIGVGIVALCFGTLPPFTIFDTKNIADGVWEPRTFRGCTSVEESATVVADGALCATTRLLFSGAAVCEVIVV